MVNMWWKCIFSVILFHILQASAEYECNAVGNNVTCSALEEANLYDNLTVALTRAETNDLHELRIEDSSISVVKSGMFVNFPNIQVLRLINISAQSIEQGAFDDLVDLKKIYLTDNYLQELNSNVFLFNNSIRILDLSHNLLNNLDEFSMEYFPALTIMNISHNRLEYLPQSILDKLKEENNFYLIADNNPWNCLHPQWLEQLTEVLVAAFCTDKTYDSNEMDAKVERLSLGLKNNTKTESESDKDIFYCLSYTWKSCLLWAFGGIWVGIILGNMCKLKRLLFTTPKRFEDKNTQCDKIDLLQKV